MPEEIKMKELQRILIADLPSPFSAIDRRKAMQGALYTNPDCLHAKSANDEGMTSASAFIYPCKHAQTRKGGVKNDVIG